MSEKKVCPFKMAGGDPRYAQHPLCEEEGCELWVKGRSRCAILFTAQALAATAEILHNQNTERCQEPEKSRREDGCNFCRTFDFSTAGVDVEQGHPQIVLGLCNSRFDRRWQFNYCPLCGRQLP